MAKTIFKNHKLAISPLADLSELVASEELVAFNIGPDEVAYAVAASKPGGYRVLGISGSNVVFDASVSGERLNIHDVQPLPANRVLLVCFRTEFRGADEFDKNGHIYSRRGALKSEILLGDGIQCVQATASGVIWTSYFDEGVFGSGLAIGAPGLIAWDTSGRKLYEFQPTNGLDFIDDCYALNVASESDVWCYYYTQFPLVRIRDFQIDAFWKPPVKGCDAFAVADPYVLFHGGYKHRHACSLLKLLPDGHMEPVARIELQDAGGQKLKAQRAVGRGPALSLVTESNMFRVEIPAVLDALGICV